MEKMGTSLSGHRGASSVEYAILVALIAAIIVAAVTLIGGNLKAIFDFVSTIVVKP
jgi:pilus assembly protein Flp/PilA